MPIANCIIAADCPQGEGDIIQLWARESGQKPQFMSLNFVTASHQFGAAYTVTANLLVPSIWSQAGINTLQLGLAKALASYFSIEITQVHVISNTVGSGMVVENGQVVTW